MNNFREILKASTQAATAVLDLGARSHSAISGVVGGLVPVLKELRKNEEGFREFARSEYGVKVTGKCLDTTAMLAIKTAFHNAPSNLELRKKFNQWCIALLYLEQQPVPAKHLTRYIADVGGVAGCVKAWRRDHKTDPSKRMQEEARRVQVFLTAAPIVGEVVPAANNSTVLVVNKTKDANTLEALAQEPGYVLLVAKVDDDFCLSDLRVVGRNDEATAVLKRLANRQQSAAAPAANDNLTQPQNEEAA